MQIVKRIKVVTKTNTPLKLIVETTNNWLKTEDFSCAIFLNLYLSNY